MKQEKVIIAEYYNYTEGEGDFWVFDDSIKSFNEAKNLLIGILNDTMLPEGIKDILSRIIDKFDYSCFNYCYGEPNYNQLKTKAGDLTLTDNYDTYYFRIYYKDYKCYKARTLI